uniref:UPAR/Ly6 domain-containing protein n=1 Tax=Gongylonema pulchrum TaxID=637853 RepID=A0A183CUU4_9BILA
LQGGPATNNGSAVVPLQECHPTAYSCMKTVDLTTNMASYYCSSTNCTTRVMLQTGEISDVAVCYNTTNDLQMNCCCYTDGCNSSGALRRFSSLEVAGMILIFFFLVSF